MTNGDDSINGFTYHGVKWGGYEGEMVSPGLTKREYFAAMAMQGMCAQFGHGEPKDYAERAIKYADALINELNKTK